VILSGRARQDGGALISRSEMPRGKSGDRHHQRHQDKLEQQHASGATTRGLRPNRARTKLCDIWTTCGTEYESAVCIIGDTHCFPELRVPSLGACSTSLSGAAGPVSVVQWAGFAKWRWGWVDCGGRCWPSLRS